MAYPSLLKLYNMHTEQLSITTLTELMNSFLPFFKTKTNSMKHPYTLYKGISRTTPEKQQHVFHNLLRVQVSEAQKWEP